MLSHVKQATAIMLKAKSEAEAERNSPALANPQATLEPQ